MKYKKIPAVIEAEQFEDIAERLSGLVDFMDNQDLRVNYENPGNLMIKIKTLEATMVANVGEFIIKGANSKLSSCRSWDYNDATT